MRVRFSGAVASYKSNSAVDIPGGNEYGILSLLDGIRTSFKIGCAIDQKSNLIRMGSAPAVVPLFQSRHDKLLL
jgi:hypothetical protein